MEGLAAHMDFENILSLEQRRQVAGNVPIKPSRSKKRLRCTTAMREKI